MCYPGSLGREKEEWKELGPMQSEKRRWSCESCKTDLTDWQCKGESAEKEEQRKK